MKKLRQHEDRGGDYDSYIPISVMKREAANGFAKENQQSLDFFEESAYFRLKVAL